MHYNDIKFKCGQPNIKLGKLNYVKKNSHIFYQYAFLFALMGC